MPRRAQCRHVEEAAHPFAAGDVGLQAVDGVVVEQLRERCERVAVLACSDLERCRGVLTHEAKAVEVVRADRLLEPGDSELRGESTGKLECVGGGVRAVRVDVQLAVVADRRPRDADALGIAAGLAADLHLDARYALVDPAGELVGKLGVRCTR